MSKSSWFVSGLGLICGLVAGAGCSHTGTVVASADPQMKQYQEGLEALLESNYLDANTKFEELANKTLDQNMQELAKLRLGDTLFYQGRFRESAEVFREYLTQHDDSPDAPHAAYMRGLAFLRRCPEDSWLMPPAESREMSDVELAYAAFIFLVQRYPDSYHALRAKYHIAAVAQRRCRNHQYVADYYEGRGAPGGTIQRLEQGFSLEDKERAAGYLPPSMGCIISSKTLRMLAEAYLQSEDPTGFWRTYRRAESFSLAKDNEKAALLSELKNLALKKGWTQPAHP